MSDQPSGVNTTKLTQKDAHFSFNFIPTGYTTIRCIELENGDHAQDFFFFLKYSVSSKIPPCENVQLYAYLENPHKQFFSIPLANCNIMA